MPGRTSSPTIRWSVSAFSEVVQPLQKRAITVALLGEAPDERQRRVGDLTPAAVDGERVAALLDLDDLGHALVVLLLLVGRVRDRPWDGVVLLAGDHQQRATLWVPGVDLRLGPGVEVGRRGLEQRLPRGRHGIRLVQLLGLFLADRVREAVAE